MHFCMIYFLLFTCYCTPKLSSMAFLYSCGALALCLYKKCTSTASILPKCTEKPRPKLLSKAKHQAPYSHSHMLSKAQPPTTNMLEIAMHKAKYGLGMAPKCKKRPCFCRVFIVIIYLLLVLKP